MYTKYMTKAIEVTDVTTRTYTWGDGGKYYCTFLVINTKSGHEILTQYYKPEHKEMTGVQTLKITQRKSALVDWETGETIIDAGEWFVDLGLPRIKPAA